MLTISPFVSLIITYRKPYSLNSTTETSFWLSRLLVPIQIYIFQTFITFLYCVIIFCDKRISWEDNHSWTTVCIHFFCYFRTFSGADTCSNISVLNLSYVREIQLLPAKRLNCSYCVRNNMEPPVVSNRPLAHTTSCSIYYGMHKKVSLRFNNMQKKNYPLWYKAQKKSTRDDVCHHSNDCCLAPGNT